MDTIEVLVDAVLKSQNARVTVSTYPLHYYTNSQYWSPHILLLKSRRTCLNMKTILLLIIHDL